MRTPLGARAPHRAAECACTATTTGLQSLGIAHTRDALLYVPANHSLGQSAPLAVMLHGAAGSPEHGMSLVQRLADAAGLVVLAPPARRETWDVLLGDFGPDVEFIDTALATAFDRCAVDPERVAIGGFSDGARHASSTVRTPCRGTSRAKPSTGSPRRRADRERRVRRRPWALPLRARRGLHAAVTHGTRATYNNGSWRCEPSRE